MHGRVLGSSIIFSFRCIPLFCKFTRDSLYITRRLSHTEQRTVDSGVISHHEKFANDWWDDTGFMRALHSMNTLRVPLIRDGLLNTSPSSADTRNTPRPLSGFSIIDVGCGGGLLSEPLARLGAQVTGIDASYELIEVARNHAKLDPRVESALKYENTTVEVYSRERPNYYDALALSEVIEHVVDKKYFLEECVNLVKPGGSVFITTLNRTTISWLGAIVAAENILGIVPKDTHDWSQFITPNELQVILGKCGCSVKLIHGMCYNPLTDNWWWSKNTSINYAIHAVKNKKLT